jgi:hypothetical protein
MNKIKNLLLLLLFLSSSLVQATVGFSFSIFTPITNTAQVRSGTGNWNYGHYQMIVSPFNKISIAPGFSKFATQNLVNSYLATQECAAGYVSGTYSKMYIKGPAPMQFNVGGKYFNSVGSYLRYYQYWGGLNKIKLGWTPTDAYLQQSDTTPKPESGWPATLFPSATNEIKTILIDISARTSQQSVPKYVSEISVSKVNIPNFSYNEWASYFDGVGSNIVMYFPLHIIDPLKNTKENLVGEFDVSILEDSSGYVPKYDNALF